MSSPHADRSAALRTTLAAGDTDAMMILTAENRRYLSGFRAADGQLDESAGALFISARHCVLATDSRYVTQARREAPDWEVVCYPRGLWRALPDILTSLGCRRLAVESRRMTVQMLQEAETRLKRAGVRVALVPGHGWVEALRAVKSAAEVQATRRAIAVAENALEQVLPRVTGGPSESRLAWELECAMRENGADGLAFAPIVAAGPSSAEPHAVPGQRRIAPGAPLLIDWGARVDGYCSDISRTFFIGAPDDTFSAIYAVVREAQRRAIAAIEPGVDGRAVDAAAREHIARAGWGEHFGHGLGHGTGLAAHECPRLSPTSTDRLTAGMIVTVEPGIYLPGWGGVRLENQVLVTTRGADVLTGIDAGWQVKT